MGVRRVSESDTKYIFHPCFPFASGSIKRDVNCSSGDAWGFVLPVQEYCSAVWCSAADAHLKLLDRVVSGACFIAGGVLNCDLSHRRSVAGLCMLYKIRCNPKHPLCVAVPVPVHCVTALCASPGYTRCFDRTSVYLCAFPLQDLAVPQDFYSPLSLSLE